MAQKLKNILQSVFKQENWKLQLLSEWESIVGNLASKMRLEKVEGVTLHIGVYQSSWMHELFLLSAVIKKSINKKLGKEYIKAIRLHYVEKKSTKKDESSRSKRVPKKIEYEKITLTKKEEHALQNVKDEELKNALHNFLSKCHYQKVSK